MRRASPAAHVVQTGVALSEITTREFGDEVITCGVAGGLTRALKTGAVVVPDEVIMAGGERIACDRALSDRLVAAAEQLGHRVNQGLLLTSATLLTGPARDQWASAGCVAVDMETGFIRAPRIAAVRVILDTPEREISDTWLRPASALTRPAIWPQALWLWREAPRCAQLAADIVAAALRLS